MFLPFHDQNALKLIPFQRVTVALIIANIIVFVGQIISGAEGTEELWLRLGFIPGAFFGTQAPIPGTAEVPGAITLISYSFLHGDALHLGGNMLFLWIFGDNIEDALGHWRFLLFYMLGAAAAALSEGLLGGNPYVPLIGASGATSACLGAYIMLHPRVRIWILLLMRIPIPLPAYGVIGLWVAMQLVFAFTQMDAGTAWFAHLGGFVAGALLVIFMRKPSVELFDGWRKPGAPTVAPSPWAKGDDNQQ